MKAWISGAEGFVGSHLKELLVADDWEICSFDLHRNQNLLDYDSVRNNLDKYRPTHIFHLAAQAYVPESFLNPKRAFEVNTIGSLNLLEAIRQLGIKTRILLAGTSEEYGDAEPKEYGGMNPQSPYAISKLAMDHLGQLYAKAYGLQVVVTRAFNHAGPGRGEMYAESAFAKQIVEVENGTRKIVEHGNLESVRNYTDVRDIVKAYKLAIELPPDVYNICSDQNVTMQSVMNTLVRNAKKRVKTQVNPNLYRPADFSFKTPSCDRFKKLTGWEPTIPLKTTLVDILGDWRSRL